MSLKSARKISTANIDYFKNSQNLLRLPLHGEKKNHLNVVSSSNSILELQFLRQKNRQISVANITFKLLKRNIKLLGMRKGILKRENSLHLKAVRKTSPWFPAAAKAARAHLNDSQ